MSNGDTRTCHPRVPRGDSNTRAGRDRTSASRRNDAGRLVWRPPRLPSPACREYGVDVPDPEIGEIASAIHVRHVQTPMSAASIFTRSSQAAEVVAHMERHKYDVTPVFPDGADREGGLRRDPDATLWKADLEHLDPVVEVRSAVRQLTGSALIDSNATLVKLLERFRRGHRFMLVVGGRGLEGMVTPFDMNKQAGRTHLFMQISALEMALSDRLRAAGRADDEILQFLPKSRAAHAKSRFLSKQARDEATDLVAALDFQDLLDIERGSSEFPVLSDLSAQQVRSLTKFRNSVMHAVLEPAGDDSDRLRQLLSQTALITRLLDGLEAA
jgi:hypothetical protein